MFITTISFAGPSFEDQLDIPRISVDELKGMMAANKEVVIIDVRSRNAYKISSLKIKGDMRVLIPELLEWAELNGISKDVTIVTYCT